MIFRSHDPADVAERIKERIDREDEKIATLKEELENVEDEEEKEALQKKYDDMVTENEERQERYERYLAEANNEDEPPLDDIVDE